jgi:hypothetical protein
MTAPSRNSIGYQRLLAAVEAANPGGDHHGDHRQPVQPHQLFDPCLAGRPPAHPAHLHPQGACWLNLQEGWWRLFRREAFAG